MARAFSWRDFLTLFRYRNREVFLDNSLSLTHAPGVLTNVMLSMLLPNSGFCTAVQPGPDGSRPLLGQFHCANARRVARLTFLAPEDEISQDRTVKLCSSLCKQAGEMGAFQVLAEVEQDTTTAASLRQTGFQPYAEQRIWLLPSSLVPAGDTKGWAPISREDEQHIQHLYKQIIPRSVQRVEPAPRVKDIQGWAYRRQGQLRGIATFTWGPKGVLVDVVMDPEESSLEGHITALFQLLSPYHRDRFYFRVRTYQQKIASALERVGASKSPLQLAMVKYLAVQFQVKKLTNLAHLEKQPDITTPFAKSERETNNL